VLIVLGSGSDTTMMPQAAPAETQSSVVAPQPCIWAGPTPPSWMAGFDDTVVGFNQAAGASIQTPDNPATVAAASTVVGGTDMLISLSDGSTLLLKYVTGVDATFFHS
jgi:hypothetical protein